MTAHSPCLNPKKWCTSRQPHIAIVQHYVQCQSQKYQSELQWFSRQSSVRKAVARAAIARSAKGKRLLHQRHIRRSSLAQARSVLLANLALITSASSFSGLHQTISLLVKPIGGLGPVYIYDTALRIAVRLSTQGQMLPSDVYVHADSLKGARKLLPVNSSHVIPMAGIPVPFNTLLPHEVENLLCLYLGCL